MKKIYSLALLFILLFSYDAVLAQDQIETNGGHTYKVKIVEETAEYVEFYFLHDEDREIRKMSTQNILKITKNAWEAMSNVDSDTEANESTEKTPVVTNEASVTKPTQQVKVKAKPKEVVSEKTVEKAKPKEAVKKEVKKPIVVKEENDITCLYDKEGANAKTTKSLYYNSVNINSAPITLLKKFTLKSVKGEKEGDKIYLRFKILGANAFSMKAKNKVLVKMSNGSVVDLYNTQFTTSEYKTNYEATFRIEIPEFHLSDLIEHKSLRFRFILDNGYIEFTNNARTSHWVSRALLCVS